MAEPLKELISRTAVRRLGRELEAHRPFPRQRFVRAAARGLEEKELKDRVLHVAAALRKALDERFSAAADHIVGSLPPPLPSTDELTSQFLYWPYCTFFELYGDDPNDFDTSMQALHQLTQRFSAEFAIRPFLLREPERTFAVLDEWSRDPSPHVRRLCSEGSRPYLPWGRRLGFLIDDPSPTLPLLRRLVSDESLYVRRSVANHVNDLARHAPELALELTHDWWQSGTDEQRWVVRHALRSLVKKGDARALEILGYGPVKVSASLSARPETVAIGESIALHLEVKSRAKRAQPLLVDYAVHFVKADGSARPKVFKWKQIELTPGASLSLQKKHSFRQVSTRRHYPGTHRIEVQINGRTAAATEVVVEGN
ncbi:MAG: DNA alkylation repair protein [Acidobacteriota bacterium]